MQLKITKKDAFLNNFLSLLSKVAESAVIKGTKGKISSLLSTSDNTIIVNAVYADDAVTDDFIINVPDLKKLYRVISCIENDILELDLGPNYIGYNANNLRFKYHLYDDNILTTPKINLEKLSTFEFDGEFTLPYSSVISLVKGSTISTESNKIYIGVKESKVFGELTDKTRPNIDSYGIEISQDYKGTQFALAIPLNFEIFRIISSMRCKELKSKLITKLGVVTLDLDLDNTSFKFVISALAN
jgi:hypothetical protein